VLVLLVLPTLILLVSRRRPVDESSQNAESTP
jgi:hypothetical protein